MAGPLERGGSRRVRQDRRQAEVHDHLRLPGRDRVPPRRTPPRIHVRGRDRQVQAHDRVQRPVPRRHPRHRQRRHQPGGEDRQGRREDHRLPSEERMPAGEARRAQGPHVGHRVLQRGLRRGVLEALRLPRRLEEVHLHPVPRLRQVHPVAVPQAQGRRTAHPEALLRPVLPRMRAGRRGPLGDRHLEGRQSGDAGVHPPEVQARGRIPGGRHPQAGDRLRTGVLLGEPRGGVQEDQEGRRDVDRLPAGLREADPPEGRHRGRRLHPRSGHDRLDVRGPHDPPRDPRVPGDVLQPRRRYRTGHIRPVGRPRRLDLPGGCQEGPRPEREVRALPGAHRFRRPHLDHRHQGLRGLPRQGRHREARHHQAGRREARGGQEAGLQGRLPHGQDEGRLRPLCGDARRGSQR